MDIKKEPTEFEKLLAKDAQGLQMAIVADFKHVHKRIDHVLGLLFMMVLFCIVSLVIIIVLFKKISILEQVIQ